MAGKEVKGVDKVGKLSLEDKQRRLTTEGKERKKRLCLNLAKRVWRKRKKGE